MHRSTWLGPCFMALTSLSLGCSAAPKEAAGTTSSSYSETRAPVYLALGDSVAFGYDHNHRDFSTTPSRDLPDQTSFAYGYPEALADLLAARDQVTLPLANVSCPGEATGSFIDGSRANDNDCWDNRHEYPLHYEYDHQDDSSYGARTSQLDWAIARVREAPERIKLVTLTLGANDLGRAAGPACNDRESPLDWGCFLLNAGDSLLGGMEQNFERIFDAFGEAGYRGPLVVVDYYSLSYGGFFNPTELGTRVLNAKMHDAAKAALARHPSLQLRFVEGFDVFEADSKLDGGDACAAGLTNRDDHATSSDGKPTCDAHPSRRGHQVLAETLWSALTSAEQQALVDAAR